MFLFQTGIFSSISAPTTGEAIPVNRYDKTVFYFDIFATGTAKVQCQSPQDTWFDLYSQTYGGQSGAIAQFDGPFKYMRVLTTSPFSGTLSVSMTAGRATEHI